MCTLTRNSYEVDTCNSGSMLVNVNFFLSTILENPRCGLKKAKGLTTTLLVQHSFMYISLPSLHDYDMKVPS